MKHLVFLSSALALAACGNSQALDAQEQNSAAVGNVSPGEPSFTHHEDNDMEWYETVYPNANVQLIKLTNVYVSNGGWIGGLDEENYGWGSLDSYLPMELDYRAPLCLYASRLDSDAEWPEGELIGRQLPEYGARSTTAYCFKPGEWGSFMDELKRVGGFADESALDVFEARCKGEIQVSGTITADITRTLGAHSGNSSTVEIIYDGKIVDVKLSRAAHSKPRNECE